MPPTQRKKGVQYENRSLTEALHLHGIYVSSVSRKGEDQLGQIYKKIKHEIRKYAFRRDAIKYYN